MENLISKFLLVALAAAAVACSSGKKALERGDYYDASLKAVERLRSDPANSKARHTLAQAYPMAVADAERTAAKAAVNRSLKQLESNIGLYERMNRLGDEILHCPAAMQVVPDPRDYAGELNQTMDLVGPMYYDLGMAALDAGTLESARTAFDALQRTVRYTPGYRDAAAQLEKARYLATLRVVVTRPLTAPRYQLDAEWFYTQLMNEITRKTFHYLVRFYTPEEAQAERMDNPHQVLYLDFADFTVGNTASTSNTSEFTRDDVVVGTTTVNGQKQDVRGTVKAKYTLNRLEIISAGVITVRITDGYTSRVLNQRAFPGKSVWFSEWASFNGDERALSKEQVALCGRKALPLPPPQELFVSFASPLYAGAASYIGSTYQKALR